MNFGPWRVADVVFSTFSERGGFVEMQAHAYCAWYLCERQEDQGQFFSFSY